MTPYVKVSSSRFQFDLR